MPTASSVPRTLLCVGLLLPWLGPACLDHAGARGTATPAPLAAEGATVRFSFRNTTQGPRRELPAYLTFTGRNGAGQFCHLDRQGRFLPCSPADNVIPKDGRAWCDYGIPVLDRGWLELPAGLPVDSGRLYLSVGSPLFLRVDEATLGLVQPDPANPADPNRAILYDWVEFTLDRSGFHGNTTCVDQFGLPVALWVSERTRPDRPLGPVGLTESRSALFADRAELPPAFASLADPQDGRILAPGHGPFQAGGAEAGYFQGYIDAMWRQYRAQPLVLDLDAGTFRGRVDAQDRLVFTRAGDPADYVIRARPSSAEVLLCNGVLAAGSGTERMLGAQLAALLNRHLLEDPRQARNPAGYYRGEPCNHYARFWHEHGLEHRAYGFAYDDVDDQSSSLYAPDPLEITVACRWD